MDLTNSNRWQKIARRALKQTQCRKFYRLLSMPQVAFASGVCEGPRFLGLLAPSPTNRRRNSPWPCKLRRFDGSDGGRLRAVRQSERAVAAKRFQYSGKIPISVTSGQSFWRIPPRRIRLRKSDEIRFKGALAEILCYEEMRPSARRITASQASAILMSCVTITIVRPCSRFSSCNKCRIWAPVS